MFYTGTNERIKNRDYVRATFGNRYSAAAITVEAEITLMADGLFKIGFCGYSPVSLQLTDATHVKRISRPQPQEPTGVWSVIKMNQSDYVLWGDKLWRSREGCTYSYDNLLDYNNPITIVRDNT